MPTGKPENNLFITGLFFSKKKRPFSLNTAAYSLFTEIYFTADSALTLTELPRSPFV